MRDDTYSDEDTCCDNKEVDVDVDDDDDTDEDATSSLMVSHTDSRLLCFISFPSFSALSFV